MSHRPEDFITKMIRYNYLPEATCPVFHAFLERITGGDRMRVRPRLSAATA